jgi:hypothetical protein|tara:strand:- start:609 stop:761 length:153 start_codon:yes stop_codon:yes gene_type:complete
METILLKIKDLINKKKKIILIPIIIVFVVSGFLILEGEESGIIPFIYTIF